MPFCHADLFLQDFEFFFHNYKKKTGNCEEQGNSLEDVEVEEQLNEEHQHEGQCCYGAILSTGRCIIASNNGESGGVGEVGGQGGGHWGAGLTPPFTIVTRHRCGSLSMQLGMKPVPKLCTLANSYYPVFSSL